MALLIGSGRASDWRCPLASVGARHLYFDFVWGWEGGLRREKRGAADRGSGD
jgi:hypothetical protein